MSDVRRTDPQYVKTTRDSLKVGNHCYPVEIHSERRKNSRVSIGKKAIHIRLPSALGRAERLATINKFKAWASNAIKHNPGRFEPQFARQYADGDVLSVGSKRYTLRIYHKHKKSNSAKLIDSEIHISMSANLTRAQLAISIPSLLSRCIAGERLPGLRRRIEVLNRRYFGQAIEGIYLKYNKSIWGSCSAKRNINISTRLLFAPDKVIDYVCIHELAHLVETNHSKRFWAQVARAMPDFKERQQWLRENENRCWF